MIRSAVDNERFEAMVKEASEASFQGWDFSYIAQFGGDVEEPKAWSYEKIVQDYLRDRGVILDMGTGGGEFLATLQPLPANTYATEGYPPNIAVARTRLAPLGVTVVEVEEGHQEAFPLPFEDSFFELIINRHEAYDAKELFRILKPGGIFITQQVGYKNSENLRIIFGSLEDDMEFDWELATGQTFLEKAGLTIIDGQEHLGYSRMYDIRTLVYLMKVLPWEFPNFDPAGHTAQLRNIHLKIIEDGYFDATSHRFMVIAQKPQHDLSS